MYIFLTILFVFLDQISKYLVSETTLPIRHNFGFAFGLFPKSGIVGSLALIALIVIVYLQLKSLHNLKWQNKLSLCLLMSGGIGNLFDRVKFGYVRDFIDLRFFPVFNFADILITFGLIIYVYKLIRS